MKFGIKDRILLLGILPQQGDILALRALRKLREELSFSDEEITACKIAQTEGRVTWDQGATAEKEISVSPFCSSLIVKSLTSMSSGGTLTFDHLELYERFIPSE